jgi:hypothetical protein
MRKEGSFEEFELIEVPVFVVPIRQKASYDEGDDSLPEFFLSDLEGTKGGQKLRRDAGEDWRVFGYLCCPHAEEFGLLVFGEDVERDALVGRHWGDALILLLQTMVVVLLFLHDLVDLSHFELSILLRCLIPIVALSLSFLFIVTVAVLEAVQVRIF